MDFRTAAVKVNQVAPGLDFGTLMALADLLSRETTPGAPRTVMHFTHDALVESALNSPTVMAYVRQTKKINAIKELRLLTGAGLKESKEAIEDFRVGFSY